MGSKGSKTTTSTQSQDWGPTEDVANRYRALLDRITGVANTPYQAYTGQQVAGFSPDQLAGFQAVRDASGIQTPYLQSAADYARQGAAPISGQQIANYYNPYQQSVVDATMASINQTNAQQQQQLQGNAVARGALGGDRLGVAQAELARQQNMTNNSTLAGIQQQGFNTALGAAQQDAARAGQAAYTFGSLGQTAQNLAFNNANALMNTGGLQQQLNQAQLNVPYQQFLQQQAFPYQQAQWLAGLTTGVGSQMGGHSEGTGSTTQPGPSGFGQIMGGLTSGLGLLGQSGAFGSAGWLAGLAALKDGGAVKGIHRVYAAGGTVPESTDTLLAQQKALLDGKRPVQMFPNGTRELPLPRGILRIKTENGVFHYDPAQIDGETIKHLSSIGRENELLGLGPYSKDDVAQHVAMGEAPLAIVERDPEGTEYRAAAGTSGTASDQINEMMPDLEPGNQFYLEEPDTTLSAREAGYADGGGIGSPYKPIVSWVPEIGMTAQPMKAPTPMNVPGASQERGGSPDMAGLSKGLGALGGGLKDLFNKPMDISAPGIGGFEPTGMGETMFTAPLSGFGGIYAAGGTVSGEPFRGYDGGGIVDEPLTFADRFAPAQEALTGGIFDPQGANYSDLEQRLPVASVPLPMARPQPTDAPVMVGTAPTISGETPSALNPSGGINTPYDRPVAYDDAAIPANAQLTQAAPKREIPWAAITAAGLGMLASESPYAGVAIGQGGLQGLKTYAAQQEAERKQAHDLAANAIQQRRVDLEARRLDDAAKRADAMLAETTRYHTGLLDRSNFKPTGLTTEEGHPIVYDARKPGAAYNVMTGEPVKPGQALSNVNADALLDDDTVNYMAQQYRAGDTSVMTNLGRGAQGAKNIVRLRQAIQRQNAEAGITGADQAIRNAEYFGTKAGQRTLGTKQANIELAATEFKQVIPVVQEASLKVDRTRYPDLNRIIQAAQEKTGDPNIVAFGGGINTLVNLYARAISPSGVPTVSDKDHARELLNKAWSQGQFDAAVGMMQREIDAALTSPEKVRDEMRERFTRGHGQGAPAAHAKPQGSSTAGFTGRTATGPNGQKLRETTDGKWVP